MTIIQDWNNWRSAVDNTKKIKNEVKKLSEKKTKSCSPEQYWGNYMKKLQHCKLLKNVKNADIPFGSKSTVYCLEHNKNTGVEQKAIECRASSCFYRLVYDRPNEPREETNLYDKCVYVRYDGSLDERHCAGCEHHDEMKDYIALQNKLETAKAEQYKSRDALLRHLFFWKQRKI